MVPRSFYFLFYFFIYFKGFFLGFCGVVCLVASVQGGSNSNLHRKLGEEATK